MMRSKTKADLQPLLTIRRMFGERVANVVMECSDTDREPKPPWRERKVINLVEDRHHGLLNDFVLQRRDAQWTLPSISLRNKDSS